MKTVIAIPPNAQLILNKLHRQGHQAFVVGGCVRDSLLGEKPNDWDVATSATPSEAKKALRPLVTIDTGIKYGTITALVDGAPYEVTTYRVDGAYSDGRRPDSVAFTRRIEDDLSRRDFTMNAMAYNEMDGLIDLFGGQEAIESKEIAAVGTAKERFREDSLRILRALRFAAVYGFSIEAKTDQAMFAEQHRLRHIAVERLAAEFQKMLCGEYVLPVLLRYREVVAQFVPQIKPMFDFDQQNPYHQYDVWEHTARAVSAALPDTLVRLAAFYHDSGKPHTMSIDEQGVGHFYRHHQHSEKIARESLNQLRFPKKTTKRVCRLVYYHDAEVHLSRQSVRRWLNRFGEADFHRFIALKKADVSAQGNKETARRLAHLKDICRVAEALIEEDACFQLKDLAVNGHDVMAAGFNGAEIGAALNGLLQAVLDETVPNQKADLLRFLQTEKERFKRR